MNCGQWYKNAGTSIERVGPQQMSYGRGCSWRHRLPLFRSNGHQRIPQGVAANAIDVAIERDFRCTPGCLETRHWGFTPYDLYSRDFV